MDEAEFRNKKATERTAALLDAEIEGAAAAIVTMRDSVLMADIKAELEQAYADGIEQCAVWHESRAREIGWDFVEGRAHRLHAEEIRRLKP